MQDCEDHLNGPIVIVGAGHAGGTVAALLRQYGHTGEIVLLGDEPYLPYQRPPLSKAWLKGEVEGDDLLLRQRDFYAGNGISVRLEQHVAAIDRVAKHVVLRDGSRLEYGVLVLAMGSRARPLSTQGAKLNGVLSLRSIVDAERLQMALCGGARLAIIGGGYVGLEVAASARTLGANVTIIERESRCLSRVACETLSDFFQGYHRGRGVNFEMGATIESLTGADGRLVGVHLSDGRTLPCDVAVIGVGAQPNVEIARDAGLPCTDGIDVDRHARTSDPAIYAIGDVTYRPIALYGRMFRLESVPNVQEQAKQAAAQICGKPGPKPEVPWFWSDQYDLKLQIAGIPFDVDRIISRGDPDSAHFALFHLNKGRVAAVEAVNAPQAFMIGRSLIASGGVVQADRLADLSIPMREVAG